MADEDKANVNGGQDGGNAGTVPENAAARHDAANPAPPYGTTPDGGPQQHTRQLPPQGYRQPVQGGAPAFNPQAPHYAPSGRAVPPQYGNPAQRPDAPNVPPQGYPANGGNGPKGPNGPVPPYAGGRPASGPQPPYGGGYGQPVQENNAKGKTGGNRKLFIGLGIGGGVIVLVVIIALVAFFALRGGKPEAQDYNSTLTKVYNFQTKQGDVQSKLTQVYSATYKGGSTFDDDDVAKVKAKLKEYRDEVDSIKDDKSMNDAKVKEKYDAYVKQADAYATYATNLAESGKTLSDTTQVCGDRPDDGPYSASFVANYTKFITSCTAKLDTLSQAPDKAVAKYATDMKENMNKTGEIVKQLGALGNPTKIQYGSPAYEKYKKLSEEFNDTLSTSDITTDFSDALKDEQNKAYSDEQYNALKDALQDGFQDAL